MARKSNKSTQTQPKEVTMTEEVKQEVQESVTEQQIEIKETGTVAEDTTTDVGVVKEEATPEVKEEVKPEPVKVTVTPVASAVDKQTEIFTKIKATGNTAVVMAFDDIATYMEEMKPGKTMTSVQGAKHQANLFYAVRNIIEHSGDHFNLAFTSLLKLIDLNDHAAGVFYDTYVLRFTENLALTTNDQHAFKRIINLLKIVAPVKGRAEALKQVSFTKSLQYGLSDAGRQRILTYFNM